MGEERKETRLQGLKDHLAVSDDPEAEMLRQEVERLEQGIEDLTEFSPGSAFDIPAEGGLSGERRGQVNCYQGLLALVHNFNRFTWTQISRRWCGIRWNRTTG